MREHAEFGRTGLLLFALARKRQIGPLHERAELVDRCKEFLRLKHNVLLVGPNGAGKTSFVESLAPRIAAPPNRYPWKEIVRVNASMLAV